MNTLTFTTTDTGVNPWADAEEIATALQDMLEIGLEHTAPWDEITGCPVGAARSVAGENTAVLFDLEDGTVWWDAMADVLDGMEIRAAGACYVATGTPVGPAAGHRSDCLEGAVIVALDRNGYGVARVGVIRRRAGQNPTNCGVERNKRVGDRRRRYRGACPLRLPAAVRRSLFCGPRNSRGARRFRRRGAQAARPLRFSVPVLRTNRATGRETHKADCCESRGLHDAYSRRLRGHNRRATGCEARRGRCSVSRPCASA
jgi:hypothetical protein